MPVMSLTAASGPDRVRLAAVPFGEWHDAVSATFVPLEAASCGRSAWRGHLQSRSIGSVQLSRVSGDAVLVRRTPRGIQRSDPHHLKLGVQVRGRCVLEQEGREVALVPGDLVLYDTSRPYRLSFDEAFETLVAMFPRRLLRVPDRSVDTVTARRVSGRRGVGAAVRPFLDALTRQLDQDDVTPSTRLSDAVLDLLAATLADELDCGSVVPEDTYRRALFLRVLSFIDAGLDDPDLNVAGIARAHHVSVRYLHKLFEDEGRTVMGHVRQRRLERCRRDLEDPVLRDTPISEVAGRWGLCNPAAFSRAFRRVYGMSPSDWRALAG